MDRPQNKWKRPESSELKQFGIILYGDEGWKYDSFGGEYWAVRWQTTTVVRVKACEPYKCFFAPFQLQEKV